MKKIIVAFLCALFVCSCASYERRSETLRAQHPQWDQDTISKLAGRNVQPGMTREMVMAAMGSADSVSNEGEEEVWGYAYTHVDGEAVRHDFVYFVHFKADRVVRTRGDTYKLQTLN